MKNTVIRLGVLTVLIFVLLVSLVSAAGIEYQQDFEAFPVGPGGGDFTQAPAGIAPARQIGTEVGHGNFFNTYTLADTVTGSQATEHVVVAVTSPLVTVECDARYFSTGGTNSTAAVAYRHNNLRATIILDFPNNEMLARTGAGNVVIGVPVLATWQTFRMEIDYNTNTFDVYVDDVEVATDLTLETSIALDSTFRLYIRDDAGAPGTNVTQLMVDNILIESADPPPAENPSTGDGGSNMLYAGIALVLAAMMTMILRKKRASAKG